MSDLGFFTWKIVQLVLWAGLPGVLGFLTVLAAVGGYIGYLIGRSL